MQSGLVPRWLGQKPINPNMRGDMIKSEISRSGAWGLAEDVRYYGDVIRKQALEKIGNLYPKVTLPREQGRTRANVIAPGYGRGLSPAPTPPRMGRMFRLSAPTGFPPKREKSLAGAGC